MALQQPGTSVPAKNGIVVVRRVNRLGFGEAAHRFGEQGSKGVRRAAHAHLCLGSPFMQKAGVIEALVVRGKSLEKSSHFPVAIRPISAELVRDCEAKQAERELVFGLDC